MKVPPHLHFAACLGVAICFWLAVPNAASAQMLLNGSFEEPALVNVRFAPGSGADWTATSGIFVTTNAFGFGTTPYGSQWEDFSTNATDTQTISSGFVVDIPYTLSLVASDISGFTGDQLTLSVSGGATASQTFTLPARTGGQNAGALPFASYALSFTPTSTGPVTVTLATGSSGLGVAVDNVQLVVPEPSTWALLCLGAGWLWRVASRRRAAM